MHASLSGILVEKQKEVDRLRRGGLSAIKDGDIPPIRDFKGAISMPNRINLIAEIKFASPSAGIIREKTDSAPIGKLYEQAGVAAISLLTDRRFFGGALADLPPLKSSVSLPILRKDFIIEEIQVEESFLWGADAVLLIARILSKPRLRGLLTTCKELGLAALTEVHDRSDLQKALDCGAKIIGINNRNLDSFKVDLRTTLELAPLVPEGKISVSESGIGDGRDIRVVSGAGVNAVLVGTSIMKSHDMIEKIRQLVDIEGE